MSEWLQYLAPWEPAPLVQLACGGAVLLYVIGAARILRRGGRIGIGPPLAYVVGVVLMYAVTQTHYDYLSQYLFFAHRGQHLVLHHLAPFLIALAHPAPVLAAGLPARLRAASGGWRWLWRPLTAIYRALQQPAVACVLFVGLIYFWLIPSIHFDAMLSAKLYWVMNWSMALDGLLFWWLMLEHGGRGVTPRLAYGLRILLLAAVMLPQILLGAFIALSRRELFDVYAVCGRAWPITPMADQHWGGLITWIPAAMMSALGAIVVLRFMLHDRSAADANGAKTLSTHRTQTT